MFEIDAGVLFCQEANSFAVENDAFVTRVLEEGLEAGVFKIDAIAGDVVFKIIM